MKKYRKNKRYYYFRRQKILGGALVLLGIISAIVLEGDITVAMLIVPLGLCVLFTKKMVLMDEYYFEQNQKIERTDRP